MCSNDKKKSFKNCRQLNKDGWKKKWKRNEEKEKTKNV